MGDNDLDPVAELAIQKLAELLGRELGSEIHNSASRALDGTIRELETRAGQIEAATQRVVALLASIGDEMRTRASHALSEGVRSHVVPIMEQEGGKVVADTGNRLAFLFERVEGLLAAQSKSLSDAASQLSSTLRESIGALQVDLSATADLLINSVTGATTEIMTRGSEKADGTNERIVVAERTLQGQILSQASTIEVAISQVGEILESVRRNLAQELAAAEGRLVQTMKDAGQSSLGSLSAAAGQISEALQRDMMIHEGRFRRLWRVSRAIIIIEFVILLALLLTVIYNR